MSKTRDDEWFAEDQSQWWDDQKRDEEELQQLREAEMMDALRHRVFAEVQDKVVEMLRRVAAGVYRQGFKHGFAAALLGAVAFIYFG
jgi:hypothetical protein